MEAVSKLLSGEQLARGAGNRLWRDRRERGRHLPVLSPRRLVAGRGPSVELLQTADELDFGAPESEVGGVHFVAEAST